MSRPFQSEDKYANFFGGEVSRFANYAGVYPFLEFRDAACP
jgi:hypothetical protein